MSKNLLPLKIFEYENYYFHSNGSVYSRNGYQLKHMHNEAGSAYVFIRKKIGDKIIQKKVTIAVFIYRSYYNLPNDKWIRVGYKDADKKNCDINNLYEIKPTPVNFKLTMDQVEEICYLYNNKSQRSMDLFSKPSPSVRDLAKLYNVSPSLIQKVLQGDYKKALLKSIETTEDYNEKE